MKKRMLLPVTLLCLACAATIKAQSDASSAAHVVYRNTQYNFCLVLPPSWRGFTVIWEKWEGDRMEDPDEKPTKGSKVIEGPKLRIRNPNWTEDNPYEDIPIMIFTQAQWKLAETDEFSFSAAPIGPSKMASNERYVFALPARYNYDFATGWQEVNKLVSGDGFKAPCKSSKRDVK